MRTTEPFYDFEVFVSTPRPGTLYKTMYTRCHFDVDHGALYIYEPPPGWEGDTAGHRLHAVWAPGTWTRVHMKKLECPPS